MARVEGGPQSGECFPAARGRLHTGPSGARAIRARNPWAHGCRSPRWPVLKQAVNQGIVPGPRVLASTRAIVATGSYQPKFIAEWNVPQGAEEADGVDSLTRVVRDQIGRGADWI